MLTMRMIGQNDCSIREDGQPIGRIRYAHERTPGIWRGMCRSTFPARTFGSASSLNDANAHFKTLWLAFKEMHGPDRLARASAETNLRKTP
jgi:hypothetical protein